MKVLGISTSPRTQSNSDILLRRALAGAQSAGAEAEYIRLCKLNIAPCSACGTCYATGNCPIQDDFQIVLPKLLEADRLVFATPIFFMSVCAQAKILIDRCQCLWARKYVLTAHFITPQSRVFRAENSDFRGYEMASKQPLSQTAGRDRRAMVIAVGGTKSRKMFECVRSIMKYYLDALDMTYFANLFAGSVDEPGKIADNTAAMERAFQLGAKLAGDAAPAPETPIEVELTG